MRASSLGSLGLRQADEASDPNPAPQKPPGVVVPARAFSWKEPAVLGAVDGLITSFVIVASGAAGALDKQSVVVVLASSLVADAFSMGVSEYLSSRLSLARTLWSALTAWGHSLRRVRRRNRGRRRRHWR